MIIVFVSGHDFSRAIKLRKRWAVAPAYAYFHSKANLCQKKP